MRQSQRNNLLRVIGFHAEGILWRNLIGPHTYISTSENGSKTIAIEVTRSTAARHLPRLIKDGLVQKTVEPRKKGERGRQSQRYKLAPGVQETCRVPAIVIQGIPFFGSEKERLSGDKTFQLNPHDRQIIEANPTFVKALKEDKLRKRREIYRQHRPSCT